MDKQAVEIIVQYGGEISEDYSGRGMYGEKTTGITFEDDSDFFKALAEVLIHEEQKERELIARELRKIRTDNMGMGIIYY